MPRQKTGGFGIGEGIDLTYVRELAGARKPWEGLLYESGWHGPHNACSFYLSIIILHESYLTPNSIYSGPDA